MSNDVLGDAPSVLCYRFVMLLVIKRSVYLQGDIL